MTFDEWWEEAARQGQWCGDYKTDAKANAEIGWNAAMKQAPLTEVAPTWDADFVAWLRKETPITFSTFRDQFDRERKRELPQNGEQR